MTFMRSRFEFLSEERRQNFILVRSLVDWTFKFTAWNAGFAALFITAIKTKSIVLFLISGVLAYLLIGFIYKFLEYLVKVKNLEGREAYTNPQFIIHIVIIFVIYGLYATLAYYIFNSISYLMIYSNIGNACSK